MPMNRIAAWLVFGLVVSACGSTEPAPPASAAPGTTAVAGGPSVTTGASSDAPETPTSEPARSPNPDRPVAPDFELVLSDGGTFTLSAETRPVYLVFWAEW